MQFLKRKYRKGMAMILALFFIAVFSSLIVAMSSMADSSVQISGNQQKINRALSAAQSGMECAKYLASNVTLPSTNINYVTEADADNCWSEFCNYLGTNLPGGGTLGSVEDFTDGGGCGEQIVATGVTCGSSVTFDVRFYRYDSDPYTIRMSSTGSDRGVTRTVNMSMDLGKSNEVMTYAIASRGRMWITGDSTIHGDIYSSWDRYDLSPFNMTDDSAVEGTINTVLELDGIQSAGDFEMETLNADDNPLFYFDGTVYDCEGDPIGDSYGTIDADQYMTDVYGNPVYDEYGCRVCVDYANRIADSGAELQGYHENVNYGQHASGTMPGMDISDYDTSMYYDMTCHNDIPESYTIREYFPHAAGDYSQSKSGSQALDRHVYEDQTFTNARLPRGRHALFKNCTFEGVLYVDIWRSSTSYSNTNNVRFEDCTFNGVVVSDVPQSLHWKLNCFYYTGEATFDNQSGIQEATIMAPGFNVNLGNTNPEQSDNNVLTGAVVGGIVDVRGNAQIYGTIISMWDTTGYSSGYVTNIGATLGDGGSETTELGDIGVIEITPDEEQMLPSGVTTPIELTPNLDSYSECF